MTERLGTQDFNKAVVINYETRIDMKKSKEHIEAEIIRTLKILDDMQGIKAHHLFRAHLMQRVDETTHHKSVISGSIAHSFNIRLAFIAALLLINIASAVLFVLSDNRQPMAAITNNLLESFSEDYTSPALSYYAQPVDEQSDNE